MAYIHAENTDVKRGGIGMCTHLWDLSCLTGRAVPE